MSAYAIMQAGPHMDMLIAEKAMGWSWEGSKAKVTKLKDAEGWVHTAYFEFKPSTNIAHAWRVVEKFRALEPCLTWNDEQAFWWFNFDKRPTNEQMFGDTAALAICRAVLEMHQ